jgi:putative FmdB family regulatory protein
MMGTQASRQVYAQGGVMPAYEYVCQRCEKEFVAVMSVKEHDEHKAQCPTCHGNDVRQIFTTFIAKTTKKS